MPILAIKGVMPYMSMEGSWSCDQIHLNELYNLYVLIHIRTNGEVDTVNSSDVFFC